MISYTQLQKIIQTTAELPETYAQRQDLFDHITEHLDTDLIKILVGMRRVGKTFMLKLLYKYLFETLNIPHENIFFLSFESPLLFEYQDVVDLQQLYDIYIAHSNPKFKTYILLDEIQNINGWEKFVRTLYDNAKHKNQIYITGSNSRLLSSEYSSALSGRSLNISVPIFSFKDVQQLIAGRNKHLSSNTDELLENYLLWGGLPETWLQPQDGFRLAYVDNLLDKILTDDIIMRFNIRYPTVLKELALYIFNNAGNHLNLSKISDFLRTAGYKLDSRTIYEYISNLQSAFLLSTLKNARFKQSGNRKTSHKSSKNLTLGKLMKFFASDNSFITATYLDNIDSARNKLLENLTFSLLSRENTYIHEHCPDLKGFQIYFTYDSASGIDIDLLLEKPSMTAPTLIPVNIAYSIQEQETLQREIKGLQKAMNYFNADRALLFIWNDTLRKTEVPENITVINVKDILLTA